MLPASNFRGRKNMQLLTSNLMSEKPVIQKEAQNSKVSREKKLVELKTKFKN